MAKSAKKVKAAKSIVKRSIVKRPRKTGRAARHEVNRAELDSWKDRVTELEATVRGMQATTRRLVAAINKLRGDAPEALI